MKLQPKNTPKRPGPFVYLALIALIGAIVSVFFTDELALKAGKIEKVSLTEFLQTYAADEFETITVRKTKLQGETFAQERYETVKEESVTVVDLGLNDPQKRVKIDVKDSASSELWVNILIGVAPFILLVMFLLYLSKRAGAMGGDGGGPFSFGKSKARVYDRSKHKTKFADVAGCEEAKEDVAEVVDFLKNPKKYQKVGAKIPKGILLVGPPGTGKTLLARAIAGEADVPFFSVSGSEFVEMFVGVGASRVRDLFKTAKRNAPCIVFIDEIDAIGKKRGNGMGGGHDEREQTLNQILTEMDGFDVNTHVIVMAATNRPDVLDKALLRPGRFDRRVMIDLPDMEARLKILQVHSANKVLAPKVDLKQIASKTVGFSGADLENVLNEAAISTVKNRKKHIDMQTLNEAVEKVSMGPERRSRRITEDERKIIAHHEVGHALAGHFSPNCEPVHKVSIISRGSALGVTWFLPEEDRYLMSEQKMKDEMISLHGGRVAERMIFGQTTTGASNDLERITRIARSMIMTYGMGGKELGPVVFAEKSRSFAGAEFHEGDFAPDTARIIDQAVQQLVIEAETQCEKILTKHKKLLIQIAEDLLTKEVIDREEFLAYLGAKE